MGRSLTFTHPLSLLIILSKMKAVAALLSALTLGTLVAGAPVVELRYTKPKFTSIVVFGDSFSDNVRFPSCS